MGERNLNSDWSKSMCDRCRTRHVQTTANILLCCFICNIYPCVLEKTPQDSRQVTGVTPRQVWSQWDGCLRPRKRIKCFLATAGGHQQVKNRRYLFSSLHNPSQHNSLNLSHLIAFSSLATNSPTLYFHHLTHIQNCFLVGAAPEMRSKPLIQLQITGWKTVTSASGRSASHGSSSSPSLGDTLLSFFFFKSHSHILCHATSPCCPLTNYCATKLAFVLSTYFTQT